MKKILFSFIFLLVFSCCFCQETFKKTFGGTLADDAHAIAQTYDGGYVIAGDTYSFGSGKSDVYIVKFDSTGNVLWNKTYGGNDYDHAYAIIETNDSGYAVTGVSGGNTNYLLVLKLDRDGNFEWSKYFTANTRNGGNVIRQTYDGGLLICGYTSTNNNGSYGYLVKTDNKGNLQWSKKVFDRSFYPEIKDLVKTKDSGYAMIANFPSPSYYDIYLIKTDSAANFKWAKSIIGKSNELPSTLKETSDKGFIIGGSTFSFSNSWEMFAIKTDSAGNLQWSKNIGTGPGAGALKSQFVNSVIETKDKGFLFAGTTDSSVTGKTSPYIVKTDSNGNLQWTKVLHFDNPISAISGIKMIRSKDGGFAAASSIYTGTADDILLFKFDSTFNICGDYSEEGTATENGKMANQVVNITSANTTSFSGSAILQTGSGVEITLCDAVMPFSLLSFTAAKTQNGNLLDWVTGEEINSSYFQLEKSNDDRNFIPLVKINAKGNSTTQQHYSYTDNKNIDGTNYYRLKMVDLNGYYRYSETRMLRGESSTACKIYPNPAKDFITLEVSRTTAFSAQIKIISLQGKTIQSFLFGGIAGLNKKIINTSALQPATYFLQINAGNEIQVIKFVKQ